MKENVVAVGERRTFTREAWRFFQVMYTRIFGDNLGNKGLTQLVFDTKKPFFEPYGLPIQVRHRTNEEGIDVYEPWGYDPDKEKWFRLCCGGGDVIDDEPPEITRLYVKRRAADADDEPPEIIDFTVTKGRDS